MQESKKSRELEYVGAYRNDRYRHGVCIDLQLKNMFELYTQQQRKMLFGKTFIKIDQNTILANQQCALKDAWAYNLLS